MKIDSISSFPHSQDKVRNEHKDGKPTFTRQEKVAAPASNRDGVPNAFPLAPSINQASPSLPNGMLRTGVYKEHQLYFAESDLQKVTGYAAGSNASSAIIPSMLAGQSDLEGIESRSVNMNLGYEVARHQAAIARRSPSLAVPFIQRS